MKDFEDFESFEEKPKKKIPFKIKITKQHLKIIGVIILLFTIYYVYTTYFTPKNVNIICKTENGYTIPCPEFEILNKDGKKVSLNDLVPGEYTLIIKDSDYYNGKKLDLKVGTEKEQTIDITLDGIDIKYVDTNVTVYPKLNGTIKIVFKNPYKFSVPYEIDIEGKEGYFKKFEGKVGPGEQIITVGDVFCKSSQRVCLGRKKYLEYTMTIKYGDIKTKKKIYVYILPDIRLRLDGPTSIDLQPGQQIDKTYTVTLDRYMPMPIYNMSLKVEAIDPFVAKISKEKFDLVPGNPVTFTITYKYVKSDQKDFDGTITFYKDLYEYKRKVSVHLREKYW